VDELRDELGFSAGLAVWGTAGPTFVRMAEADSVVILSVRPGSVMPIVSSATGRVFGAYLPPARTRELIKAELHQKTLTSAQVAFTGRSPKPFTPSAVQDILQAVRNEGLSSVAGDLNLGIHALSAPLFDHAGGLVGAISIFGGAGLLDITPDGRNAHLLRQKAAEVSRQLGHL
jgi:DNA-binding IclR family transcriptional regulator